MASLHYLFYNDKDKTTEFCTENGDIIFSSQIGDNIFSFMSLDLSEYEEVREEICNYASEIDNDKMFNKLYEKYPTFAKDINEPGEWDELSDKELTEHIEGTLIYLLINNNSLIYNHNEILNHPYVKYSDLFIAGFYTDLEYCFDYEVNLKHLQSNYIQAIPFCFDVNYNPLLNELTAYQRYYLFIKLYSSKKYSLESSVNYSVIHFPTYTNDKESFRGAINSEISPNNITPDMIKHIKSINPSYIRALNCDNPKSIAFNEFRFMLDENISIKRCKNCGKYFTLKGDYATDYCDRIPDKEKYTCKKIAAIATRKEKLNNNPIIKEYEKAYKRMYARNTNHKITSEEFKTWVDTATTQRDLYEKQYKTNPNAELINEFKQFLGNK